MIAQPDEPFNSSSNEEPNKKDEKNVTHNLADLKLWSQFKGGNRRAFSLIYQQYASGLTQYGMRLTRDRELVRDVIQDLFIQLWESKERLGEVRSIKSYLFVILRREVGKRVQYAHLLVDDSALEAASTPDDSGTSQFIGGQDVEEIHEKLSREVGKLPARQQEAIFLKYYCELDFIQVAQVMSITTRAVYKLISKAIDHLQQGFHSISMLFPLFASLFLS